jgi:hypothetical protein
VKESVKFEMKIITITTTLGNGKGGGGGGLVLLIDSEEASLAIQVH